MLYIEREQGQGLLEYSLLLVLIAIVVFAALLLLGPQLSDAYGRVVNAIPNV